MQFIDPILFGNDSRYSYDKLVNDPQKRPLFVERDFSKIVDKPNVFKTTALTKRQRVNRILFDKAVDGIEINLNETNDPTEKPTDPIELPKQKPTEVIEPPKQESIKSVEPPKATEPQEQQIASEPQQP